MFRITDNTKLVLEELSKQLLKMAYRLLICFENKHKNGEECNEHYHGFIEMDGTKTPKSNYDRLRYVLDKHKSTDRQTQIKEIPTEDEKPTMAYVSKQKNIVAEYNTSYDVDSLQEWWKEKQKEDKLKSEKKKQLLKDEICKQYIEEIDNKQTLVEIKLWVAKKLIDKDLLPVMGKVRAYSMYVIHKCGLKHLLVEELDKLL